MSYTATTEIEATSKERLTENEIQEVFDALDGVESIDELEERHEIDTERKARELIEGVGTDDVTVNCTIEEDD